MNGEDNETVTPGILQEGQEKINPYLGLFPPLFH
jgi:hypothetical protein